MISKNITVAICTYKRPKLLQKCIQSVLDQNTEFDFEIIVIDNDIQKTAQEIVEQYETRVQYFFQPLKGLSYARNMAVSKANGRFILFIDDDEYADKNWLSNMVYCQQKYLADVVLGKVVYEIPDKFPLYVKRSSYFTRKNITTGEKATLNEGYTGNTFVRKELFNFRTPPFLCEFNQTGGEDTEFFNFLLSKKTNIVFCDDAVIYETQDAKRLKVSWFYNRGYCAGYNYSKHLFKNYNTFVATIIILYSVFGGLTISLLLVFKTLFMPYKCYIEMVAKMANQFGKAGYLFGCQVNGYT